MRVCHGSILPVDALLFYGACHVCLAWWPRAWGNRKPSLADVKTGVKDYVTL